MFEGISLRLYLEACDSRGKTMTMELEGKVGLVTGGTSGIGRETAVLFAKAGAKVVVAGRREQEGNETIELVRAAGGDGVFVYSDVSKASEVEALIQKAVEKFGRLDIAFNNAGIEGVWAPIEGNRRRLGPGHQHQSQGRLAVPEVRDSADAQAGQWRRYRKHGVH
jgi:NAD(P)-dependent dehydrogenase (short-subunit alcohol dehydrogenase family)